MPTAARANSWVSQRFKLAWRHVAPGFAIKLLMEKPQTTPLQSLGSRSRYACYICAHRCWLQGIQCHTLHDLISVLSQTPVVTRGQILGFFFFNFFLFQFGRHLVFTFAGRSGLPLSFEFNIFFNLILGLLFSQICIRYFLWVLCVIYIDYFEILLSVSDKKRHNYTWAHQKGWKLEILTLCVDENGWKQWMEKNLEVWFLS